MLEKAKSWNCKHGSLVNLCTGFAMAVAVTEVKKERLFEKNTIWHIYMIGWHGRYRADNLDSGPSHKKTVPTSREGPSLGRHI